MRRSRITAGVVSVLAAGAVAVPLVAGPAGASAPVVASSVRTVTLVSPVCTHVHIRSVTYWRWSSTAGRYVPYSSPRVTVTDYTTCK